MTETNLLSPEISVANGLNVNRYDIFSLKFDQKFLRIDFVFCVFTLNHTTSIKSYYKI